MFTVPITQPILLSGEGWIQVPRDTPDQANARNIQAGFAFLKKRADEMAADYAAEIVNSVVSETGAEYTAEEISAKQAQRAQELYSQQRIAFGKDEEDRYFIQLQTDNVSGRVEWLNDLANNQAVFTVTEVEV